MKVSRFVKVALAMVAGLGAVGNAGPRPAPNPMQIHSGSLAASGKDMIAQRIRIARTLNEREFFGLCKALPVTYGDWPFRHKNRSQRASLRWAFRCMGGPGY